MCSANELELPCAEWLSKVSSACRFPRTLVGVHKSRTTPPQNSHVTIMLPPEIHRNSGCMLAGRSSHAASATRPTKPRAILRENGHRSRWSTTLFWSRWRDCRHALASVGTPYVFKRAEGRPTTSARHSIVDPFCPSSVLRQVFPGPPTATASLCFPFRARISSTSETPHRRHRLPGQSKETLVCRPPTTPRTCGCIVTRTRRRTWNGRASSGR